MTDEHDIPITDDVPEDERDAGPEHRYLVAEDGSIEAEEEPDADT